VSAFTISTPELRIVCSENITTSTAPANPSPWVIVNSGSPLPEALPLAENRRTWRPSAHGTTIRLRSGPAAMAIAAKSRPLATPAASRSANTTREDASIITTPP
jgi:hypothetical protein